MKTDRYYRFWDKKVARIEKTYNTKDCKLWKKQIERSLKLKMITEKQCNELIQRIDAVIAESFKNNPFMREFARKALEEIELKMYFGLISEEEARAQANKFAEFI